MPLLSIAEFLQQAAEHSAGTTMLQCGNIGEYVFAELDGESRRYTTYYPHIGQLYFVDHSFEQIQDLAKLTGHFTSLYINCIQQPRYSNEAGEWDSFSTIDLPRLGEVAQASEKRHEV
jgi:hypothetical protein